MQRETVPAVRRTYTITETAEILGISRTTAYECAKAGVNPSSQLSDTDAAAVKAAIGAPANAAGLVASVVLAAAAVVVAL